MRDRDHYGGHLRLRAEATGRFRVGRFGDRHLLITPDGHAASRAVLTPEGEAYPYRTERLARSRHQAVASAYDAAAASST